MSGPTERQVLYGLIAAGFVIVVLLLTVGGAVIGITPLWWTATMLVLTLGGGLWVVLNWRRTGQLLAVAIGLFLVWMVGTLITIG